MNDFIVTEPERFEGTLIAAAYYRDMQLVELEVGLTDSASMVGNIYTGYVDSVAKNIGGAFIKIGSKTMCYLPRGGQTPSPSQKMTVQITKDASGRKMSVCSRELSLSGKYAVVSTGHGKLAFSAKLGGETRTLLKKWVPHEYYERYHVLLRTNAQWTDKHTLNEEIEGLCARLDDILERSREAKAGTLLYKPDPFYVKMARDLYERPDRVITDVPLYADRLLEIKPCSQESPLLHEKGALSLPDLYNLNRDLDRLLSKQVWLRSGGFLVIEKTEAFNVIDVNTGKCARGRIPEETYRKINLEAAEEIARQMRLRNLGGMILVDFINLANPDHRQELTDVMKKLVRKDHTYTEVIDLTGLGIMELVRTKSARPLEEVCADAAMRLEIRRRKTPDSIDTGNEEKSREICEEAVDV